MELPKGWAKGEWCNLVTIIHGKNQRNVEDIDGKYPIYGSGGVIGRSNKYLCKAGSTIVGRKGTINKPIYAKENFWNIDTAFGISPSGSVDPKYLFYFCVGFNFANLDKSTTIPSLTQNNLLKINMPIPPLSEQHRIVEKIDALFSELDKGVEILQTVKEQLRTYRQSVLKSAFEGRLPEVSNINFSTRNIVDFFEVSGGLTKNSNRDKLPVKMPYLRVANVYFNYLDLDEIKSIGVTESEVERTLLFPGDLLFVEGNGSKEQIGRVAIWNGELDKCLHQNHIIKGRPNGLMNVKYALYYLMSKAGRDQILTVASSTSGLYTLSINKIKTLMLPFCSEQQKVIDAIESRLSVCDKVEQLVDENLAKASALRQSILKKAFEGRLVPQDPNDEPAEKLLERIKAERAAAEQRMKQQKSVKRSKKNG